MTPEQVSSNQHICFHFRNYEMLEISKQKTEQNTKRELKTNNARMKTAQLFVLHVFFSQHSNIKWHIRPTQSSVSQILLKKKLALLQEICTSSTHGLRWDLIFQGFEFTKDSASILISFPLRAVHHNIRDIIRYLQGRLAFIQLCHLNAQPCGHRQDSHQPSTEKKSWSRSKSYTGFWKGIERN